MTTKYTQDEMNNKWKEFNDFLDGINAKYAEELKEKNGIRNYVVYGTNKNDVAYNFDSKLPDFIKNEIIQKLLELFPRKQFSI